jgi:hypothetical protein
MADNIQIKDASNVIKTVRTNDISGSDLHVPVHRLDGLNVVGPAAQSLVNTDLLTGTVNGWYDAGAFFAGSIQIVATAGITAGAVIFEQTNDNSSTTGIPLAAQEVSTVSTNPIVTATTIAASTRRAWQVPVVMKYIRARISTAFAGGTVQAHATFSQQPYAYPATNVQQASAANLLATVSQATAASLQTTATPATPTTLFLNSLASTNATSVKASAGTLFGLTASNTAASARFIKLFNLAVAPTVGTSVPVLTVTVPAGGTFSVDLGTLGLRFGTGIALAITAAAGDADATAVAANDVKVAMAYV